MLNVEDFLDYLVKPQRNLIVLEEGIDYEVVDSRLLSDSDNKAILNIEG
jgi:hypothetical protein